MGISGLEGQLCFFYSHFWCGVSGFAGAAAGAFAAGAGAAGFYAGGECEW